MESVSTEGVKGAVRRSVLLVIAVGCVAAAYGAWRWLGTVSPEALPALNATEIPLKLKVVGPGGVVVSSDESILVRSIADSESQSGAQQQGAARELQVVRYPLAFSMYVQDGKQLLAWLRENKEFQVFLRTPLVQGVFSDLIRTAKVRAEDVKLSGARGAIMEQLLKDIVTARLALHYDIASGSKGLVLQFDRQKSDLAKSLLPLVTSSLAKRSYRVPGMSSRIYEVLIGEQTLLLAQQGVWVFISNGLPALLNVMDQNAGSPPKGDSTLALTVRTEAFLDNLLPILTGRNQWHANARFTLASSGELKQDIQTDPSRIFGIIQPSLSPGVLAAIPQDSFVGLAGSFAVPAEFNPQSWYHAAADATSLVVRPASRSAGPPHELGANQEMPGSAFPGQIGRAPAGVAIVWDLFASGEASLSQVGLAIAAGKDFPIERYANDGTHTARCAGDTMALLSTSPLLLTRMREACDRQSPSLLARFERGASAQSATLPQLVLAFNPGPGLGQMLEVGIRQTQENNSYVSSDVPKWKAAYDQAVASRRADARATMDRLPAVLFSGAVSQEGANLVGQLLWPGGRS